MKLSSGDLRLFAAVADMGGITAAATKLGVTKSLVSRELAALEARLGVRLVQRTTRRVALTDIGELLATYARRVAEELDSAEAAIDATRDAPRGDLKVSAPFSVLRFLLAPHLARFRERYPDIRLFFDVSVRMVDLIEEGVDVAIRIGPLASSSLMAMRLAIVPQILVAAPEYLARRGAPSEAADLIGHDVITLRRDLNPEIWTLESDDGAKASVAVTPKIALMDPGLAIDLAVRGLGIGVAPEIYAREALAAGALVPVLPGRRRALMPIHAVYPSRRTLAPKVRAFIEFAAQVIGAAA